ncbi:hypothetical protein [uncultured Methanobrevibacter sp.]|uniref:hypothetical protein n=1 Tax=uncultured Methanobrevibacter sp. TaxID=253161 RepID=UPI0025F35010|nr:hypothetical protein [uncultured Methanobrevibacter sp.]
MEMKTYKVGPRRTKCVPINQYNEIKEDYLKKKEKKSFLYKKYYQKYALDKHTFNAILEEIYTEHIHPKTVMRRRRKKSRLYHKINSFTSNGYSNKQYYKNPPKTSIIPRQHNN